MCGATRRGRRGEVGGDGFSRVLTSLCGAEFREERGPDAPVDEENVDASPTVVGQVGVGVKTGQRDRPLAHRQVAPEAKQVAHESDVEHLSLKLVTLEGAYAVDAPNRARGREEVPTIRGEQPPLVRTVRACATVEPIDIEAVRLCERSTLKRVSSQLWHQNTPHLAPALAIPGASYPHNTFTCILTSVCGFK
jgi:hypothetical protein